MKFKAKENVNIKTDNGFVMLKMNDQVELNERFVNHPQLEVFVEPVVSEEPVVSQSTKKKVNKK